MRPNFFSHLHPPTIPEDQARWRFTLGAGGMLVFLFVIIFITGVLELFFYVPSTSEAGNSIQTIAYHVPFGWLIRNLHFWAGQFFVIVGGVHLARVVLTGAYAKPRRFNYLLGLGLFLLGVFLDFTGYVLRWDTGIQWALVVGTNLVRSIPLIGESVYRVLFGGGDLGQVTLTRFFAWHIFGITIFLMIFIIWHIFRVRRDGGISTPPPAARENPRRISRGDLVRREVLAMLIAGAVLVLVSILFPAPIEAPIEDISIVSGDAQAPWFFLWVQQMLKWGDPFLWGILVPVVLLLILAALPYLFPQPEPTELGRWFPSSGWAAQITFLGIAVLVILLTLIGVFSSHAH